MAQVPTPMILMKSEWGHAPTGVLNTVGADQNRRVLTSISLYLRTVQDILQEANRSVYALYGMMLFPMTFSDP